ncbi:MAG: pyruvate kinase [Thermoplasmata archaeon]|nr:pyruvate kinase [Thermoplasmata archaeon]
MRRTKILATVGPATSAPSRLRGLLGAGVDAFRLNFSHGSDTEHRQVLRRIRSEAAKLHREVGIVADLQGPKIRIGALAPPAVRLEDGATWRLDTSGRTGDTRRASVTLPELSRAARVGDPLLLGDGSVELVVERVERESVLTRVVHGGMVASHAGLFLPRAHLRTEILGVKDRADLAIGLEGGADFVAVSFVRGPADVRGVRRKLAQLDHSSTGIIAKIERAEALERVDEILDIADGIMVARGDLGIEVPLERLAFEQKRLVAKANSAHRIVIVATQMLLSMLTSPRPTRAEATDVANAVLDGADAVMLSEESAVGQYPIEAVGWLDRICRTTEEAAARGELSIRVAASSDPAPERFVADAAVELAEDLGAAAIVTPTHSGRTARLVATRRSSTPILALSSQAATRRQLSLTWGVEAHASPAHLSLLELRALARRILGGRTTTRPDAPFVLTAGYPIEGRPTNLVTVLDAEAPRSRGPRTARRAGAARRGSAGRTGRVARARR